MEKLMERLTESGITVDRIPSAMTVLDAAKDFILSWRFLALILLLTNLKSLPGAWTVQVWYTLIRSFRSKLALMKPNAKGDRMLFTVQKSSPSDPISKHPLFTPETMSSHAPLLEIDYNLHKSNSTYFMDLDFSRSKLMGGILAPVWPLTDLKMEVKLSDGTISAPKKVKGRASVILGAVHTSFRKEITPYARYDVQSRILSWDARWIYIGTWFLQPSGKKGDQTAPKVLACSLSKYIIKKGRITVRPALMFTDGGLLPPAPSDASLTTSPDMAATTATETSIDSAADVTQRTIKKAVDATSSPSQLANGTSSEKAWTWQEIEDERLRGMEIVKEWAALDLELEEEFTRDHEIRFA